MGIKVTITIDGAKLIDSGVWKARLKPEEVITLGDCSNRSGPFSVVLLESTVDYNSKAKTLTFDPDNVRVLNVGDTEQIFLFSSVVAPTRKEFTAPPEAASTREAQTLPKAVPTATAAKNGIAKTPEYELSQALATGDKLFLSELPIEMREIGESLLSEIRSQFPGELNYEPRSAKFDETPEIFWTVKIQPQNHSLRITVRGTPEMFKSAGGIDLKLDKFGYSAFIINRIGQLPEAVDIIKQAHKNLQR